MNRIVERVRKLIALSGSPNDHEGRSAAFMACRLIREHGLEVGDPSPHARRVEREPAPRRRATRGPYVRARDLRGEPRCRECSEPILRGDGFLDAEGSPLHGDCVPGGERP